MDKSVKRIRPSDFELSQVQDNLADCIQQLLDQANGNAPLQAVLAPVLQQLRGAGTPYSVKTPALLIKGRSDGQATIAQPTVQIGEPQTTSTNGVTIPQKDAALAFYGQAIFIGSPYAQDGFVIAPLKAGIAFRIPNIANTTNVFFILDDGTTYIQNTLNLNGILNCTANANISGTTTANSFVSAQGFKNTVNVGTFWNSNYAANTLVQLTQVVQNQAALGGVGLTPFVMKFTHNGSIVGATLNQAGPNTGLNQLLIYKNGTLSYTWNAGAGANNATFWGQFPKSTAGLTFLAGDTLTTYYRSNAAGNSQVLAHLTIEMVA